MRSTVGTGSPHNMHGSSEHLTASLRRDENDISASDMVDNDLAAPASVQNDAGIVHYDGLDGTDMIDIYGERFSPFEISGEDLFTDPIDYPNTALTPRWDYVPTTNHCWQTQTTTSDSPARETTAGFSPHFEHGLDIQPETHHPDLVIPQPFEHATNNFATPYSPGSKHYVSPYTNDGNLPPQASNSGDVRREINRSIDSSVPSNGGGEAGQHGLRSTATASQAVAQTLIPVALDVVVTSNPPGSRKRAASSPQTTSSKRTKLPKQSSKGNQLVKFENDLHPDPDAKGPLRFTATFTSAAKAREYIAQPPREEMRKFLVRHDDLKEVLKSHHQLGQDIVEAIFDEDFEPAGETWTDTTRAYYESNQKTAMEVIKRDTKTEQDHKMAIAHVYILLDEIVRVNSKGIPKKVLRELEEKRGHTPELGLSTMERARIVIAVIRKNKTVAKQVVRGESLAELARSPISVEKSKRCNAALNAKRAAQSKAKGKKSKEKKGEPENKHDNDEDKAKGGMIDEG